MRRTAARASLEERLRKYRVTRCRKHGCTLSLNGLFREKTLIIDCDRCKEQFDPDHELCDYIILLRQSRRSDVAVIEMKSRNADVSYIWKQLCGGAQVAEKELGIHRSSSFHALLLHKGMKSIEYKLLQQRKYRVPFGNSDYIIVAKRCGTALADIISPRAN